MADTQVNSLLGPLKSFEAFFPAAGSVAVIQNMLLTCWFPPEGIELPGASLFTLFFFLTAHADIIPLDVHSDL